MAKATHVIVIPSDPAALKKIKGMVTEATDCLLRGAAEKEALKDIIAAISEEFDIPKSFISKLVRAQYNADFDKVATDFDDLTALVDAVQNA
jgi:hypothetical protein